MDFRTAAPHARFAPRNLAHQLDQGQAVPVFLLRADAPEKLLPALRRWFCLEFRHLVLPPF